MPRINLLVVLTSLFIALLSFIQNDHYGAGGGLLLATAIGAAWYWQGFIFLSFVLVVAAFAALSNATGEYAPFMRFMALLVMVPMIILWVSSVPRKVRQ